MQHLQTPSCPEGAPPRTTAPFPPHPISFADLALSTPCPDAPTFHNQATQDVCTQSRIYGRVFLEVMNSNDMRFLCFHFLRAPWCQRYTYHQNVTGECIPTCFMSGMLWNSHPLKTVSRGRVVFPHEGASCICPAALPQHSSRQANAALGLGQTPQAFLLCVEGFGVPLSHSSIPPPPTK